MSQKGKIKIFKLILLIIVLIISIGIILYLFPVMRNLSTIEGQVAFKEKVSNSGAMGMLLLFGLQVAQIFLIVVPGEPSKFIVISTFARFPSVITSTLAGEQLSIGEWKMSIILYVLILVFIAILIFIITKLDKENITKEAINSVK